MRTSVYSIDYICSLHRKWTSGSTEEDASDCFVINSHFSWRRNVFSIQPCLAGVIKRTEIYEHLEWFCVVFISNMAKLTFSLNDIIPWARLLFCLVIFRPGMSSSAYVELINLLFLRVNEVRFTRNAYTRELCDLFALHRRMDWEGVETRDKIKRRQSNISLQLSHHTEQHALMETLGLGKCVRCDASLTFCN